MIRTGNVEGEGDKCIGDSLRTNVIEWLDPLPSDNEGPQKYGAFKISNIVIFVESFINICTGVNSDSIAYIESMHETGNSKEKLMTVRWLHKVEEIDTTGFVPAANPREVFMTDARQDLLLETCNRAVTVLSWDHMRECIHLARDNEFYFCRRKFCAGNIEVFDIETLEGYWKQEVLAKAGIVQVNENERKGLRWRSKRRRSSASGGLSTENKMRASRTDAGTSSMIKACSMSGNTEVEVLSEDHLSKGEAEVCPPDINAARRLSSDSDVTMPGTDSTEVRKVSDYNIDAAHQSPSDSDVTVPGTNSTEVVSDYKINAVHQLPSDSDVTVPGTNSTEVRKKVSDYRSFKDYLLDK